MLSGIKQRGIVGKGGKIEIQASDLPEGTVVEIIVLIEPDTHKSDTSYQVPQDTTEYLLSTEANRRHLMSAIEHVEKKHNLVSFTPEEWDEEYNIHS
ncbi:MAG: hypothetical protein F6J86_26565 [Symploca sp. SIO1B1]|nr:hypothetical protein [Symploca sp. SIO1C2]NER97367.1 hypothetical protein [Symploca sp. SIO1B1]